MGETKNTKEQEYVVACVAVSGKGKSVFKYRQKIKAAHVNDIEYLLKDGAVVEYEKFHADKIKAGKDKKAAEEKAAKEAEEKAAKDAENAQLIADTAAQKAVEKIATDEAVKKVKEKAAKEAEGTK